MWLRLQTGTSHSGGADGGAPRDQRDRYGEGDMESGLGEWVHPRRQKLETPGRRWKECEPKQGARQCSTLSEKVGRPIS